MGLRSHSSKRPELFIMLRFAQGREETVRKTEVSNTCTDLCGTTFSGQSCANVLPVCVYPSGNIKVYTFIDEQSNRTLARSQLFDFFDIQCESESHKLLACSGQSTCNGRRVNRLEVEALDGSCRIDLQIVIECNEIPDNKDEIPTPEVAFYSTSSRLLDAFRFSNLHSSFDWT